MNLAEKLKILNLLRNGERVSVIARRFNVNESTIRTIRSNEDKIRESAKTLGKHAEHTKRSRCNLVEKTEEMLIIWIQDLMHKKIPISTAAIRDQATVFHSYLNEKYQKTETFNASKGWFERFKMRFSIHNIKFAGKCSTLKQFFQVFFM